MAQGREGTKVRQRRRSRGDPLDIGGLRACLVVREAGSFRSAAAILDLQPSILSRRVRALEDHLGVSLFHRMANGARPTNAATAFLDTVDRVLGELDAAVMRAGAAGAGKEGMLQIGLIWTIANGEAQATMKTFKAAAPDVSLGVREGGSAQIAAAVFDREIDIGFLAGRQPLEGLDQWRVWTEQMMLVLPAEKAEGMTEASWPDLLAHPILVGDQDDWVSLKDHLTAQTGQVPQFAIHKCPREGILSLIASGAGVTVAPASSGFANTPGFAFVPIREPGAAIPLYAVWLPSNDNPALRRFVALLKKRFPKPAQ
jgi:DNA-binding transcriptional LysR family regulator